MKLTITTDSAAQTAALTIGGIFAGLINQTITELSLEGSLVVLAIRRSSRALRDASLEDIGAHIAGMDTDALKGFGNNVKGIYHELLYVAAENSDGDDISAQIFEMTNYPGADVKILEDGNIITEIQLKAVADTSSIDRHFERYPDISVVATDEVAQTRDDVTSSGFSNVELEDEVISTSSKLSELDPINQAEDLIVPIGLASAAIQARDILKGRKSLNEAGGQTLQDMGVAITSSLLIDLMFSS